MKQKLFKLVRFLWDPVCCMMGIVPLSCLVFARFAPELLAWAWIFPVLYGVILMVCLHVPNHRVGIMTVVGMVLLVVTGILLMQVQPKISIMAAAIGTAVMLVIRLMESGASVASYVFIVLHVVAQIQILTKRITQNPMYEPIAPFATVSFFVFLLLSMLAMNRENLQDVTMGRHKIPKSMQKKQRNFTLALFAGAFGIAAVPAVVRAIRDFLNWVLNKFLAFMDWLTKLLSGQESDDPPITMDAINNLAGDGSKGGGIRNFEDIFIVIFAIAVAVCLAWLLFKVIARVVKSLRDIWKKLGRHTPGELEAYEDEVTSTRENMLKDWLAALAARQKLNAVDERSLEPGKRIRYRYLRLLMKHRTWHSSTTARENLPDSAADLYERARYSEHPITETDAQQFISDIKRI